MPRPPIVDVNRWRLSDQLRAVRTVIPVSDHGLVPVVRACRQQGIVADADLATDPTVPVAVIEDRRRRRYCLAYLADARLGRPCAPIPDEAVSLDKGHI